MAWTARAWGGAAKLWPAACTGLTGLRLIRAGLPGRCKTRAKPRAGGDPGGARSPAGRKEGEEGEQGLG